MGVIKTGTLARPGLHASTRYAGSPGDRLMAWESPSLIHTPAGCHVSLSVVQTT